MIFYNVRRKKKKKKLTIFEPNVINLDRSVRIIIVLILNPPLKIILQLY